VRFFASVIVAAAGIWFGVVLASRLIGLLESLDDKYDIWDDDDWEG